MAAIYIARDADKRIVVIRCLREDFAPRTKWRKSFLKGADILAKLDHPNIIRILEVHDRPPYYMVIEYVDAKNLRSLILNRDLLIETHRLLLLRQMASALYYIHSMGYLHLDFKPDNLLVRTDASVKLIDFDLVTTHQRRPARLRELEGTPFYIPPEALRNRRVDERADIYAFGVTAYEMINYYKPFHADTLGKARRAQHDPIVKPAAFRPSASDVPPALQSLIFKCLAKAPVDRYPSMSLVMKDLEDLV